MPISNPRPFFLLANLAPEETSTIPPQQSYVACVALGEVVIRAFGGVFGSQSEKYDANGSGSTSAEVYGAVDAQSVSTVFEQLDRSRGRELQTLSRVCRGSADNTEGLNFRRLPRLLGRSGPTFSEVEAKIVQPIAAVAR